MTPITIERGPPQVDYINVPIGTQERLSWELGTEDAGHVFTAENLTGRAAEIVLKPGTSAEQTIALQVEGSAGRVNFTVPDSLRKDTVYLVLVEETPGGRKAPRVTGTIKTGVALNP